MLNDLVEAHVTLQVPEVRLITPPEIEENIDRLGWNDIAGVKMKFCGAAAIVFPTASAAALADVLVQETNNDGDLDSVRIGVLTEVGNIIINGVMGTIGNYLNEPIDYAIPSFGEGDIGAVLGDYRNQRDVDMLLARASFTVEACMIHGDILLALEGKSLGNLLSSIQASWGSRDCLKPCSPTCNSLRWTTFRWAF